MLPSWVPIGVFGAFLLLFVACVAYGERTHAGPERPLRRKLVYALAICVYGTTWSFLSSIGVASQRGLEFFPIFMGPIVLFAFFYPFIVRIIRLSKAQNVTSIADFVAMRYGKTTSVAALIALVATIGSIPYIALQLRGIAGVIWILMHDGLPRKDDPGPSAALIVLVGLALGFVAIVVGTRRLGVAEPQRGLMLALAVNSAIKFIAFIGLGIWTCWGLYGGLGDLTAHVAADPKAIAVIDTIPTPSHWWSMISFTFLGALVWPRSFFVTIVQNSHESDVRAAGWIAPALMFALACMVLPIAAAGLLTFPDAPFDRALTLFALPAHAAAPIATLVAFIGALAEPIAATIASAIALAIIVSNDLVIPLYLVARRASTRASTGRAPVLLVRRIGIVIVLLSALLCASSISGATLPSIAFTFLGCAIQVAPAAIGGLLWERGNARGTIGGCVAGLLVWAYTMLLPSIASGSSPLLAKGPLGLDVLRPTALFELNVAPFDQGILWSLVVNLAIYIAFSVSRPVNPAERFEASLYVHNKPMSLAPFLRLQPLGVTTGRLLTTAAEYVGQAQAESNLRIFYASSGLEFDAARAADAQVLKHTEHLLTSAIGAAASRMVVTDLVRQSQTPDKNALNIIDDIAFEIHNSHDILQHAIDIARDGMAAYDSDLRLVAWNRAYREMFRLPADLMRVGVPLDLLVRSNAERGIYGDGSVDEIVASRLESLTRPTDGLRHHTPFFGKVLEMHSVRLDNGGLFFTYHDATAQVKSEADLEAENVTLERRVRERTEELEHLNWELARAKAEAENANLSKTRFLAAASHDLLQPLNAARLYTTSLRERMRMQPSSEETTMLAANVDSSLEAVEDILGALLEISSLDAGATKTEMSVFAIDNMLRQLQIEFSPLARSKQLDLRFVRSSLWIRSDRRLLSRLLQNLISNAIKYTLSGRVLVGTRRIGSTVRIDVLDTGQGIPRSKLGVIFREFQRLPSAVRLASGAGLGLSIVERLGAVLKHDVGVRSEVGKGSMFSVTVPCALPREIAQGGATGGGASPGRQRSLEGLSVAAIDNERDILTGMGILLQGWECIVSVGTTLAEIEECLRARRLTPDVIVADYHIGELNGLEIIAALRLKFGPCPAVLITADRDPNLRLRAQEADVRVLNKPLKPAALRSLLSQWRLVKVAAE